MSGKSRRALSTLLFAAVLFLCGIASAQTHTIPALDNSNVFTGQNNEFNLGLIIGPTTAANLSTNNPGGPSLIYCSDCKIQPACVTGGSGAWAQFLLGSWNCSGFGGGGSGFSGSANCVVKGTSTTSIGCGGITDTGTTVSTAENTTITTGAVDFSGAATFKLPVAAGFTTTTSGIVGYDSTSNNYVGGVNGVKNFFALQNQGNTYTAGAQDYSGAGSTIPWITGNGAPAGGACTVNGQVYYRKDGTLGQQLYFCNGAGTWTLQLNSGTAGASTALSNLASVAFNIAITPASGNLNTANADIGSASLPIRSAWVGTAATNNTQIFSADTAARTFTLPDASGTAALLGVAQTWANAQSFPILQSTTANPALSGFIRFANTDISKFRNAANNGDLNALSFDNNNLVQVGDAAGIKAFSLTSVTQGSNLTIQPQAATTNSNGGDLILTSGAGNGTGANGWLRLAPSTIGSGGIGYVDIGSSALTQTYTNDGTSPAQQFALTVLSSTGTAIKAPTNATVGILGVCVSASCNTPSANVSVAFNGTAQCTFDNTATPGDVVVPSSTAAGSCHDAGTTAPASVEVVGVAGTLVANQNYNVFFQIGGGGSSTVPTNVIVSNPGATQTIQSTSPTVPSLVMKCPSGAAGGQVCAQIQSNTGANLLSITQAGTATFGSGTGGSFNVGTVTASKYNSGTGTIGTSNTFNLANLDGFTWENNAGNASTTLLSKTTGDNLQIGTFVPATAAQLVFGTSNLVAFKVNNPAGSYTLTFPDPGGNDSAAYLNAIQTFTQKTIGDNLTFNNQAAPANPSSGFSAVYIDSTTGQLSCKSGGVGLTGVGSSCMPTGGGGGGALSAITAATGSNTIGNGVNAQRWNWALTANTIGMRFAESAASTGGTGTQFILEADTAASSTASPLGVFARGTTNGFQSDPATGNLQLTGTAGLDLNTANYVLETFPNDGTTGTAANLLVKINTSGNAIKTATTDTANIKGICVNNCTTTGNAQIAIFGQVSATFDNATTNGDCVIASTTTAGDVHDTACSSLGSQLLGKVLSTNGAAGTFKMDLFPQLPGLTGDATDGLTVTTSANGATNYSLSQNLTTSGSPNFNQVQSGTFRNAANGGSSSYQCGIDGTSNTSGCTATFKGANMTGTSNFNAGNAVLAGGNDASTGTGAAGSVTVRPGQATAAANLNGALNINAAYIKGATFTTGNLQCFSANNTVADCATSATNFVGVAVGTNGNAASVQIAGTQVLVNYDATVSPSAGWFACSSAGTAGKVTAQSGACAAGRTVGIIEAGGSSVTSGNITIQHF